MQIDQLLIICYFLVVLGLGFSKRSKSGAESFLFAGRTLTIPALVATLVSTWYGGILEIGRFTYENGIVTWFIFSLFYYIAALMFARYIVPQIIKLNKPTIPSLFLHKYGKISSGIAITCIILMASPAPYLKIFSDLMNFVWGISPITSLLIAVIVSMSYASIGGFSSVVRTDKLQFILMFTGFLVLLITCYISYGGAEFIASNTPMYTFSIPGNFSWSFIFTWGFIALITIIDPGFYQRTFAGQSTKVVQKSIYISIIFWFLFDLMTITAGLYALAILPDNIAGSPYLELSKAILPPILQGVFVVSLFAIVMSTIDSFSFISAFTIGRDLPLVLPSLKQFKSVRLSINIGLLITALIAIILALYFTHAIDIWYVVGSFTVPTLLIPLIFALYSIDIKCPSLCMISPCLLSASWYISGIIRSVSGYPEYILGIDPMYPGLILSISLCYFMREKGVSR